MNNYEGVEGYILYTICRKKNLAKATDKEEKVRNMNIISALLAISYIKRNL